MRELLSGSTELAAESKRLEAKPTSSLDVHKTALVDVLRRIMQLLDPPPAAPEPEKSMGFHTLMKTPGRNCGREKQSFVFGHTACKVPSGTNTL
jgi:hypothetical protein